ncbi:hypothetical protein ACFV6E_25535 [Streptomyces sp. NPDC059785]|uniref:hypothetical protein n=1 Tax=unclassified Streptomyces TaxID=2593676 RepID=UPI0036635A97
MTAAGPTTTVTTAQATVHGLRRARLHRTVRFVRLLLIFPTSSRLYDEVRKRGDEDPLGGL